MPIVSGNGGSSPVLQATVTFGHVDIKALPGTPVEILAAPGAGKALLFLSAVLSSRFAAPYTGFAVNYGAQLEFDYGASEAGVVLDAQEVLSPSLATVFRVAPWVVTGNGNFTGTMTTGAPSLSNTALIFYADNKTADDFTGGDPSNLLQFDVLYAVIDVLT